MTKPLNSAAYSVVLLCAAVLSLAETVNYAYDDAGRLIRASYPGGKVINYTYDKAGNLLSRVIGAGGAPAITGVVNGGSFLPGIAASTWITIQGADLALSTRTWGASDFVNGNLPAVLDGVSAKINNIPAYVYFVSPAQLNVLAPDDASSGQVQVQVTTPNGTSNSFAATKSQFSPAFFPFSAKYPAAVHTTGVLIGNPGLIPGAKLAPAKPGETILLFGTGFGPTTPPLPAGKLVTAAAALANKASVTIGGKPAKVVFAGLSASGLDQLNVTIPADLPDGDATLVATVGGASTQPNQFLTVQR